MKLSNLGCFENVELNIASDRVFPELWTNITKVMAINYNTTITVIMQKLMF